MSFVFLEKRTVSLRPGEKSPVDTKATRLRMTDVCQCHQGIQFCYLALTAIAILTDVPGLVGFDGVLNTLPRKFRETCFEL